MKWISSQELMAVLDQFKDDPAVPAHSRTGTAKAGPQKAQLVPCSRKPDTHGHHPANEECPYCDARGNRWYTSSGAPEWWVDPYGTLFDARVFPEVAKQGWPDYIKLTEVAADSVTANRLCGCFGTRRCTKYVDDRGIPVEAHRMPSVVKNPKWRRV